MTEILGRNIGQYQVIEFVARGDSAYVYKGFQPAVNRYVALKILPPSLARNSDAVRQFQRQAELMAQLDHRNILPVYDYGQEGDLSYTVSRFVDEGTLEDRIALYGHPESALEILNPISEALTYIHERDLIHGNLKPTNILIDDQDQPLLADFSFDQTAGETLPASPYMSPEQVQGGEVDRRSDVFALGAILYEMMIGEPPEAGKVPSPRLKRPDLPVEVEMVILKAMAQFPEQRFSSVKEFYTALEQTGGSSVPVVPVPEPVAAEPEPEPLVYSAPETETKSDDRWIFIALGGLAIVVILCGALGTLLFLSMRDSGDDVASGAIATAKVDANVFSGPGLDYDIVGILQQGQSTGVLGISEDRQWWNITFPSGPNGQGWVVTSAVSVQNADNVPIVIPTPTLVAAPPSPTVGPTGMPPTLESTQEPPEATPSDMPPTLESTQEPPEATPSDVPPTTEPTELPPIDPGPTDEPIPPYPEPTEEPYPPYPPAESEVASNEQQSEDTGNSICGLPAFVLGFVFIGLVWSNKKNRWLR